MTDDLDTLGIEDLNELLASLKQEKKSKKSEIQRWLAEFENRHGRPASKEDKQSIRAEYEAHRRIDNEMKRVQDYLERKRPRTETLSDADFESSLDKIASIALDVQTTLNDKNQHDDEQDTVAHQENAPLTPWQQTGQFYSDSALSLDHVRLFEQELSQLYSDVVDINVNPTFQQLEEDIDQLKAAALSMTIPNYADEFQPTARDGAVAISTVNPEWLAEHSRQVLKERLNDAQKEFNAFKAKQSELIWKEHNARRRIVSMEQASQEKLKNERRSMYQEHLSRERALKRRLLHTKQHLTETFNNQTQTLEERFGVLVTNFGAQRFEAFIKAPQPMEVRIHVLRAIKDKLVKGSYALMVSVYDRLGGRRLGWSNSGQIGIDDRMPGVTRPFKHEGRYFDAELCVNQSIFALCPPKACINPANCFLFELYQLDEFDEHQHKVVGWTALPLASQELNIIEGKFKLPIMRGQHTNQFSRYCDIDDQIASNLQSWLANIYFEARKLSEKKLLRGDESGHASLEIDYINKTIATDENNQAYPTIKIPDSMRKPENTVARRRKTPNSVTSVELKEDTHDLGPPLPSPKIAWWRRLLPWYYQPLDNQSYQRIPYDTNSTESYHEEAFREEKAETAAVVDRGETQNGVQNLGNGTRWEMVNGDQVNQIREEGDLAWWVPAIQEGNAHEFTPAIPKNIYSNPNKLELWNKLRYIKQELLDDLSPFSTLSADMYLAVIIWIIAAWLRMCLHFIAQYLFLDASSVSVYTFEIYVFEIAVKYISSSVTTATEVGVVAIGPVAVLTVFGFFVSLARISLKIFGAIPDHYSRFTAAFGICTILDPLLVLLVDCAYHNYQCSELPGCAQYTSSSCKCHTGDAFKLWDRMRDEEGSGVSGLFITLLLYSATAILTTVLLYYYLVYFHMNARVLDVYRRVTASSAELSLPFDFEVSMHELRDICFTACSWQGAGAAKRERVVTLYDEFAPCTTSHIAIYEDKGARALYRHFIVTPDGTAIEIFGNSPHTEEGCKLLQRVLDQYSSTPTT